MEPEHILSNAKTSIQLGLQDRQEAYFNSDKYLSAIRNIYAGMLLLSKYVLIKTVDSNVVLKGNNQTINTFEIKKLFKEHKLIFPEQHFANINKIRNDIEHKYTLEESNKLAAAIDSAKKFIQEILSQIDQSPLDLFVGLWENLSEEEIIDQYGELEPFECKNIAIPKLKKENPNFKFYFANLKKLDKLRELKEKGYQIFYKLDEINRTKTKYMGTGLTLVFKKTT